MLRGRRAGGRPHDARRSRAAVPTAILAAMTALALTTPLGGGPAAASTAAPAKAQRTLYVLGDSLADPEVGATSTDPYLRASARSLGLRYVVHADIGKGTAWGLQQLRRSPPPRNAIVVVALGTNDIYTPSAFRENAKAILRLLRGHRVLWVNVHVSPRFSKGYGKDAAINKTLRLQARTYDRLRVLDWKRYVRRHGIVATDGLHYDVAGAKARAAFIARAVRVALR